MTIFAADYCALTVLRGALSKQESRVLFGGRLADYKYYDMAPTIEKALHLANSIG